MAAFSARLLKYFLLSAVISHGARALGLSARIGIVELNTKCEQISKCFGPSAPHLTIL